MRFSFLVLIAFTLPAFAQTPTQAEIEKSARAAPYLAKQREDALNGLAICQGNAAAAEVELAKLRQQAVPKR